MSPNADLTTHLKPKRSAQERRRQLEALLRKKAEESSSFPLSFAQQRLWILEQLDPANPVYNIPLAMRLTGPLNLDALNATLDGLVTRHESLRTRFAIRNEEPVQVVEERGRQKLAIVDLQHLDSEERESQALARALEEARRPFQLDQAPLLRVTLLRLSPNEHLLVVVMHHIISDGWSMVVLLREVMALYQAFHAGRPSPLKPLPIQYADYTVWQRGQLQNGKLQKLVDYWSQRLQDVPTLNLSTDRSRSLELRESGATETMLLPLALANRLREVARREGATLYMLLLAAFDVLLGRYSGQDDFAVGSPVAGRIGKETEGVVGFFVNALAMRVNLAGDPPFRQLLGQVKQTSLEALQHQELPFERLVEALNPERNATRHPLFQVTFSLENAPWPDLNVAGLELKVIPLDSATSKFDLSYTVRELRDGLEVSAEFSSSLFQHDTIQRMLGHFQNLLEGIAADPDLPISRIPMLSTSERSQILVDWNSESRDEFPSDCVMDLFEQRVQLSPQSPALIDGARQWTYQELDERANKIAHCLRSRGVGLESVVAIRLHRSAEQIAALWGVLKAGGAYLPLDTHLPAERLKLILEDAEVNVVVTEAGLRGTLPASPEHVICLDTDQDEIDRFSSDRPTRQVTKDDLAYVIYTSGSTGRPKGVMIEHRALTSYTVAATELYAITAADRVLQFASISFDVHVEEIYPCLTNGGTLFLRNEEMLDCREFVRRCDQWGVTFISLSTGFWHELISTIARDNLAFPAALTRISVGGEAAHPERVGLWFNHIRPEVRLLNTYGPTEATVICTAAELIPANGQDEHVPIGRALASAKAYVLDSQRQPVPAGVPGELYIGGESLARGYLNRPEFTNERFVPDPFSAKAGSRMYKTGDVVRWRPEGQLEYLSRTDHQVKIRGYRIELGEVETALRRLNGVQAAVVVVHESPVGGKQLAAYVVTEGEALRASDFRNFLAQTLPDYMIPAFFVPLHAIPFNTNGKIDYKSLPRPTAGSDEQDKYVAPRTPDEESLAEIWQELLEAEQVGVHDNFFEIGGHSLLATQLVSRISRRLQVDVSVRSIFEAPTIAQLASRIATQRQLHRPLGLPSIARAGREVPLPLSYGQEALWVISQLMEGVSPYVTFPVARVRGALNVMALERALNEVVRRHESLRTTFHERDGRPVQIISPFTARPLTMVDLSGLPVDEREEEMQRYALSQSQRPIDLAKGPLARVELIKLSADEHVLLVGMHHIIYDGWSIAVLNRELMMAYMAFSTGRPSPLAELPIQYVDFAIWQRERLQGEVLEGLRGYWMKKLEKLPTLELPTDRPRPAVRTTHAAVRELQLPVPLSQAVEQLSRRETATPFMTLAAAFQTLLRRYSGQEDFPIGTAVAGRLLPETEGLIGYFVNTLVLRSNLAGDPSFRELLARVRETALEAFEHQELPFERLVQDLNPPRDLSRHPLFQVMFVLQNTPDTEQQFLGGESGLEMNPLDVQRQELANDFDLSLIVTPTEQGYHVSLGYNTDLFDEGTIARMLGHFQTLLEGIVADSDAHVSQIPLLTEIERRQILVEWNDTARDFGSIECLQQLFEAQVTRTPDAIAVEHEGNLLTYRELNERANQLAYHLARFDVGPDVIVGVCLERSCEMVIALLGILKAGGAYMPLDPDYPADRLALMVRDSRPAAILSTRALTAHLPAGEAPFVLFDEDGDRISSEAIDNPPFRNDPLDVSYVIYTSGSTGVPKGVRNTHRGISNYLFCLQDNHTLTPDDRVLQKTPYSFDVSVYEFFWTLMVGARLVMARHGGHREPRYLLELIVDRQITTVNFVSSMLSVFLQEPDVERCQSIKRVICGGETLSYELQRNFFSRLDAGLFNIYGPTEAAVAVTFWTCRENPGNLVPLGKPIPNLECYILDSRGNPLPIGVPGELYLGGTGLARDYLNRPDLTAEKFVPHPFSSDPEARLYRTGDLCRHLPDGNILFLGRFDHQVKIRGHRIELGEIQAAVLKHPAVREAVVTAVDNGSGDKELAAYWVPKDAAPTVGEIREFLLSLLPDYMVPTLFVALDAIPVNSNGKADLKALPAPSRQRDERNVYVPPQTPLEEMLAKLYSEVLQIDRIGVHDNFFDLGGHSLSALSVVSRLNRELGINLPLREVFMAPTIAELAARLIQLQSTRQSRDLPAIVSIGGGKPLPLSYGQEALWVISQLMEGASPYVTFPVARVRGTLNTLALERALNEVVRRHDSLRTTFHEVDGNAVQVVAPYAPRSLKVVDLSDLPVKEREEEIQRYSRSESQRPIDLAKGPLARVELLKLSADEHMLLVGMHHIIYDGWSMGVLNRELLMSYVAFAAGRPAPLPDLPIQYGDFAVWQRERLQGEVLEGLRGYWMKKLEGLPTLELPTDRPRPAMRTTHGAARELQLPASLSQAVEEISRQERATPFMTLAAAFQTLLRRYSGQEDFPIGTPVAGRLLPETEGLIGYFVNTLVLRANLAGDPSFRELLARVRETALEAFEHQELPFELLVQDLKPPRDLSRHPLFQVMFVLQNAPNTTEPFLGQGSGLELSPLDDQQQDVADDFDLTLVATRNSQGFHLSLKYNTDLFDEATIQRMLGHFQKLLEGIAADSSVPVSLIPLLTDAEKQQILVDWNDTARDFGDIHCLHQLVEAQVARTPDVIAVDYEGQLLTYRELNERANQLAHHLAQFGVGPDIVVGVCLERSCELVVSLLAIMKAGGAYMPLDPDYPAERLALMVRDSKPAAILSIRPLAGRLPDGESIVVLLDEDAGKIANKATGNPPFRNSPSDIIYVIYTSGSTGVPKGARNTHRAVCNYIFFHQDGYPLTSDDRVLQKTPFSFDMSVPELFWPLVVGARLVVARPGGHRDPQYMVQLIAERQITTTTYVPSMLSVLIQEEDIGRCQSLKRVFTGGETLTYELMQKFLSRLGSELHNIYGPAEAAVAITAWKCRENPENQVLLGKPIPNTECYILDPRLNPLPIGVSGELCLGGVCLGRDYLNRPELTAEKFIPHPFSSEPGARLYRTGDRCRYLADGNIQFLGRFDHQVKIRGFRIEVGEIQAMLLKHPGVGEAVVKAVDNGSGGQELAAYWVATEVAPSVGQLREFLSTSLPDYMIPGFFVLLDSIPVNANGKADLKALPVPTRQRDKRDEVVLPRTALEEMLAKLWCDVLKIDRVGVYDNFFELGGHSLLALRVVSQARTLAGLRLPVAALFGAPTIAALAEHIEAARGGERIGLKDEMLAGEIIEQMLQPTRGTGRSLVPLKEGSAGAGSAAPLFCIHGLGGHVASFVALANGLADERPVYGLLAQGLEAGQHPHDSIAEMAACYLSEIRSVQPQGPYLLAGWSMGGLIALEAAHQLKSRGESVSLVAMFDTYIHSPESGSFETDDQSIMQRILPYLNLSENELSGISEDVKWQRIADQAGLPSGIGGAEIRRLAETCGAHEVAYNSYQPQSYSGRVVLFATESNPGRSDPKWGQFVPNLQIETIRGNHYSMLRKPHVDTLTAALRRALVETEIGPESVEVR